jgi:hypothetical protein
VIFFPVIFNSHLFVLQGTVLALALSSVINRLPEKTVCSVLILPSESNLNEFGAVFDEVFFNCGGHAYSSYGLPSDQPHFVIVRPDGVVGARVCREAREVDGVKRYFRRCFLDVSCCNLSTLIER